MIEGAGEQSSVGLACSAFFEESRSAGSDSNPPDLDLDLR